MNREIKFRVWDTEEKKMLEPFTLGHLLNNYNSEYGTSREDLSAFNFDSMRERRELEFMAFTGLLDSKGVEIYEGDIILDKWKQKKEVKIEEFTMQTYEDGCAGIGFMLETHDRDDLKELEVIGNVWENPKLIK
jgi:uncharacterized phage protein (TIGR01671 family)